MNHKKYRDVKKQKLGMAYSTARSRLHKTIIFHLLEKEGNNVCYRCGKPIDCVDEFSVDHVVDWFHHKEAKKLFLDINNIRFSHLLCNVKEKGGTHSVKAKSGYKGVGMYGDGRKNNFYAVIYPNNKRRTLGVFETAEEAARVYDEAAIFTFGDKAVTNKMLGLI